MIGITFALLVGGAVVIETVFNIPGLGRLIISAVLRRDYPVVQGVVLLIAVTYTAINLLVDLAYLAIDPRIRYPLACASFARMSSAGAAPVTRRASSGGAVGVSWWRWSRTASSRAAWIRRCSTSSRAWRAPPASTGSAPTTWAATRGAA